MDIYLSFVLSVMESLGECCTRYPQQFLSFCSTTPWKVSWREEKNWTTLWQSQNIWETSPRPFTRLWVWNRIVNAGPKLTEPSDLTALLCVHVQPAGTETELLLRSHVMPPPRPCGHASLCLSALPTTPIMPPAVESVDTRSSPEVGGIYCKKGLRVASKCDLCRLRLIEGGLKKQWGCSGVEVIFVLFLSFTSVNICAVFEHQFKTFDIVYWWCLLKQLKLT